MWTEGNGSERPLDKGLLNRIQVNWATLTELISLEDGLLDMIYAKRCITNAQRLSIEGAGDYLKKNKRLLEIMSRKSLADFNHFVVCLQDTQQGHVASFLLSENAGKPKKSSEYTGMKLILAQCLSVVAVQRL